MTENMIVFPYNIQFAPILRYRELLRNYKITGLVSLNGWSLNGKDASHADEGEEIGILVENDFEKALQKCDTVMFTENQFKLNFDTVICPRLYKAIEANKNIICTIPICNERYNEIKDMCNVKGVYFKYYQENELTKQYRELKYEEESLLKIETPVIFVLGISENTQKFEIQLSLRDKLTKMQYKISQIGSRHYCEILGFHSFPQFMLDKTVSESNKVIYFNRLIKKIENEENPDIIIVGVPGGIMPFNDQFTNRFGVLAYEVSQAVVPDIAIVSTIYEDFKREYFTALSDLIRYKLGFTVDYFNLSNFHLDFEKSKEERALSFTVVNSSFIDRKKDEFINLGNKVFNILNSDDKNRIACECIHKLSTYGEKQLI